MPREGHDMRAQKAPPKKGISIHVPREGHDMARLIDADIALISIHVPREGHDANTDKRERLIADISIHVPREGHDNCAMKGDAMKNKFQSTCPARGTTLLLSKQGGKISRKFQSTCPARGTTTMCWRLRPSHGFQSTCPARGTTANMHNFFVQICARVTNIPLKGMPYLQKTYVSI